MCEDNYRIIRSYLELRSNVILIYENLPIILIKYDRMIYQKMTEACLNQMINVAHMKSYQSISYVHLLLFKLTMNNMFIKVGKLEIFLRF